MKKIIVHAEFETTSEVSFMKEIVKALQNLIYIGTYSARIDKLIKLEIKEE